MIKSKYNVIGVMSGTSLDGIDLAYITFEYNSNWIFHIHAAETTSYPDFWKQKLAHLVNFNIEGLKEIDKDYTLYLSQVINDFIKKHQLNDIDAICSHGHTALHQPDKGFTYQIGNHPRLAKLIEQRLVCDFRVQDVALGGQGAPLVPIGDRLLFSEYDYCINLGGFANISSEIDNKRIAYDICPVNIVMNRYAKALGYDYDDKGMIAKTGVLNLKLLNNLNQIDFYKEQPPKSLGLEWVDNYISPILETSTLSEANILRTFVEHIAIQIANSIDMNARVLFTGGGTYNDFLLERIVNHKQFELIRPSYDIIEYKEALIFGLLGVLKLRGEINCLSTVTGANNDHSSGEIFYP
ncbi:anhydro-N-acetylmuramic acid kinase [Psychroserpens luteolus]|uniref:anhydro-N-acetylmuramic acid kinase n=1 Tax=Psychroserpens luteolus TaxID=2855840 RepID=UPI001E4B7BEF|nr:anhydro-N-acetylmuramic acid kinase [Psychroserpens luteolus]MCD2259723.1 anhydro-N-acetylmuramic acid kinase [Psychroserpens luteolus]